MIENMFSNELEDYEKGKNTTPKNTNIKKTKKSIEYDTETLLPSKKEYKDKKTSFSVKLDREIADRLITLSIEEQYAITSIFEKATTFYLDALNVIADPDAVAKYQRLKESRKVKSK